MRRVILLLSIVAAGIGVAAFQSQQKPAGTGHNGKAYRFNKIREGIYHVVGTGALTVVGNSSVIVNDNDVILVDDHVSPAAAFVLLDELKEITTKPVRYVINTHFHYDHSHGNQVFAKNVDIIGHEFTREMLLGGKSTQMPLYQNYVSGLPAQIENLKKSLAAESDAGKKATAQTRLDIAQNNAA